MQTIGQVIYVQENNKGPKMVPWGTALVTIVLPDSQLFTTQDCERPLSYDLNQSLSGAVIP